MEMNKEVMERYRFWCESPVFDAATQNELRAIQNDTDEIMDRFYKDLEFGTGGLRGVLGAGTNRMNIYTVRKATQGLADYITGQGGAEKGVAIAFDSRNMSPEFADEAARCLAANHIRAYIFESLRPTPELSFALRTLGCIAGIVITASHNPPEYNGYKVYWEDGAQITYPRDVQIIEKVNRVSGFDAVKTMDREDAIKVGRYQVIGREIDDLYMEALKKLVLHPEAIKAMASRIKIVYTPLHGTGNIPVRRILRELGFEQVYVVEAQEKPDGSFPTVTSPNPEDKKAFTLALDLAKTVDADLVLATDPDADRLGVYVKDSESGEYMELTGNMSGLLLCEYELSQKKALGRLPENGAIVTTIVSSNMAGAVARAYDVACMETLTGFKYIGEQIRIFEETGSYEYLFGFEESYGCLVGTHARDKDACVAVMALCEAAAFYAQHGKTLWDRMLHLYEKYGYYKEALFTRSFKGARGTGEMAQLMERMRKHPPVSVGGLSVRAIRDYKEKTIKNITDGQVRPTGLLASNVLYFDLEEDGWVCVRPSGTEPKIKYYAGVRGASMEDAQKKLDAVLEDLKK